MRPESVAEIAKMLRNGRYRLGSEKMLQEDIETDFREKNLPFEREFVLGPGERVDFLLFGRIAVELKLRCAPRMMMRQLMRYSSYDLVESIILVSATPVSMPDSMNGKPVYVANLGAGYL